MAVDVVVRPVESGDVERLVANMRTPDIAEITSATGSNDLHRIVQESVAASTWCYTGEFNGELACIFGVAPFQLLGARAAPWMLGTDQIDKHPGALVRRCRSYIADMLRAYPHLLNFVDARNTRSIRWLKRMGFQFHDAVPYGAEGLPFHLFEMKADHV